MWSWCINLPNSTLIRNFYGSSLETASLWYKDFLEFSCCDETPDFINVITEFRRLHLSYANIFHFTSSLFSLRFIVTSFRIRLGLFPRVCTKILYAFAFSAITLGSSELPGFNIKNNACGICHEATPLCNLLHSSLELKRPVQFWLPAFDSS